MDQEWKVLLVLIIAVASVVFGLVVAEEIQVVRMASRGLCYAIVQTPNSQPYRQWEKCK